MKGASIASQFGGNPGGAGAAPAGSARRASEYSFVSDADNIPVASSSRRILIPSQKLPNESQSCPLRSRKKLGSIALKLSSVLDSRHNPLSTHLKSGDDGSSVLFTASAIPDVFFPNSEYA